MKVFSLTAGVALIAFYSANTFGNICSSASCPKGRTPTTICFSDPETYSGVPWKTAATANCGYFTTVVVATDTQKMRETFSQLAKECKSIDRMTLNGHGADGYQVAGGMDSGSVQDLNQYGCLFNRNATIHFTGCNVGRGCSGDMLFYKTAQSLLRNGGTITGNTFYSSTFLPGIIPHFSLNGKGRKLTYTPSKSPADSWTQTGLAITNGGDINERCSDHLKELMDDYSTAKVAARKKSCSLSNDYVNNDRLNSYKTIQTKLSKRPPPYLESSSSDAWYDLSSALNTLKYQIRRYESCEPPARGAESSATKAVK